MDSSNIKNKQDKIISRRQFLKNAGLITGGAAITSLAMASGCTNDDITSTPPATTPGTTAPKPTPPGSTTPQPTAPTPTAPPGNDDFVYVPPTSNPEMVVIPGCVSKVAADRKYSYEHVWVKLLDNNLAVLGITDKMQLLIGFTGSLDSIFLLDPGTEVVVDRFLANLEGNKMNADIYAPLSGTIVQTNFELKTRSLQMVSEPYLSGWLYVIEYDKPEELDNLISAEKYAQLNANPDYD